MCCIHLPYLLNPLSWFSCRQQEVPTSVGKRLHRHAVQTTSAQTCSTDTESVWHACAGGGGGSEWAALRLRLLPAATAWLDPDGRHGWRSSPGLAAAADPAAAALNLLLFLLRREARDGTDRTGVRSRLALADLERRCVSLVENMNPGCTPLPSWYSWKA